MTAPSFRMGRPRGTLYLSSFGASSITEVSALGDVRQIAVGG